MQVSMEDGNMPDFNFGEIFLKSLYGAMEREDRKSERAQDIAYRDKQSSIAQANADRAFKLQESEAQASQAERMYNRTERERNYQFMLQKEAQDTSERTIDTKDEQDVASKMLGSKVPLGTSMSFVQLMMQNKEAQSNAAYRAAGLADMRESREMQRAQLALTAYAQSVQAEMQGFANTLTKPQELLDTSYEASRSRIPQTTGGAFAGTPAQIFSKIFPGGATAEGVSQSASKMNQAILADYGVKTRTALAQKVAKLESQASQFNQRYGKYGYQAPPVTSFPLFGQLETGINSWLSAVGEGNAINFMDYISALNTQKELAKEQAKQEIKTQSQIEVAKARKGG